MLTRAFGFARLQLVEESVQEAMLIALRSWRQSGVPDNPAGWMHRVARNKTLDALRREKIHERAVSLAGRSTDLSEELLDEWLLEERLPDSLLRMIFVCCHPALDRGSQLAMTLNLLCGLSVAEVARGLLISTEAAKKRIQRARKRLAAEQVQLDLPVEEELDARVGAVLEVLYLMFNEGYSASTGDRPLRDDICEEAARLCHLLCEHRRFSSPAAHALLALMLFHGARLEARVDDAGAAVLLEEQDRSAWDRRLIGVADSWLHRASTPRPTRFHFEAAIAQIHCHARQRREDALAPCRGALRSAAFSQELADLRAQPSDRTRRGRATLRRPSSRSRSLRSEPRDEGLLPSRLCRRQARRTLR